MRQRSQEKASRQIKKKEIGVCATMNQSGFLKCEATRVGEDTTLSQIIQMVSDAAATKAPIAKVADKVSGVFVPIVMAVAAITVAVWLLAGQSVGFALARGIAVLVISCPCALGLATPVAIMVGNGMGAKHGILFKTAVSLEETGKTEIVALDKTGTITSGKPEGDRSSSGRWNDRERTSSDCLCTGTKKRTSTGTCNRAESTGRGYSGNGFGQRISGSAGEWIDWNMGRSAPCRRKSEFYPGADRRAGTDKTDGRSVCRGRKNAVILCKRRKLAGVIAVADVIKEDSPQAIRELQNMGIHVVMLTGDNERTAKRSGNRPVWMKSLQEFCRKEKKVPFGH